MYLWELYSESQITNDCRSNSCFVASKCCKLRGEVDFCTAHLTAVVKVVIQLQLQIRKTYDGKNGASQIPLNVARHNYEEGHQHFQMKMTLTGSFQLLEAFLSIINWVTASTLSNFHMPSENKLCSFALKKNIGVQ